ncbi:N-acetylglucosamine kinase [Planctomycetaceae bacterium SH139]
MQTITPELFLGIDAGGSKTEAWLGSRKQNQLQLLGKGRAGPANLTIHGLEESGHQLLLATERAFIEANLSRSSTTRACLCLAGCGRSEERQQVEQWALASGIGLQVMVCSDAEILLAATRSIESTEVVSEGIGLIAGTGSIAWGRRHDGQTMRCGGWGPKLGDEGSGYAIALAAIKAACRIADGRANDQLFFNTILSAIGLDSSHELVPWAYAAERTREEIASLTPTIFELFKVSRIAQRIVHEAAEQLAQQVAILVRRLQLSGYPLAMAGGVLVHQDRYRNLVNQQLHRLSSAPTEITIVSDPVRGALRLASISHTDNR